jgi:hypothetical protein
MTTPTPVPGPPPVPPGQLTVAPSATATRLFLADLDRWIVALRASLDELDAGAQLATDPDAYTSEITLAMSLCQSIASRRDELVTVWDSGRVSPDELARIAVLMWGRLPDPLGAASAFTLTEAATLVVALTERLAAALATDAVAGSGVAGRIAAVRAALGRCRSQAEVLGTALALLGELDARLDAALASKDRKRITATVEAVGAEVTGLEIDLIRETSLRTSTAQLFAQVRDRYAELEARAGPIAVLADRCRSRIAGAPTLAVPSVEVLGPPPSLPIDGSSDWAAARAALDDYEHRLDRVAAAFDEAEARYGAPLHTRDDLRGLLGAYRTRASRSGLAEDAVLTESFRVAHDVLWSAPCDLDEATKLVERYQRAVRSAVGAEHLAEPPRAGEAGAGQA